MRRLWVAMPEGQTVCSGAPQGVSRRLSARAVSPSGARSARIFGAAVDAVTRASRRPAGQAGTVARNPVRRIGEDVTELFAHPGGRAARPMVYVLNFFNRRGNRLVASALDVRRGHRVLEVGFGGGAAMPTTMAALDGNGMLCGVDLSADMARLLADRFRRTDAGVTPLLACGDVERLPLKSETFDRAYA